jgi:hypothetical protein
MTSVAKALAVALKEQPAGKGDEAVVELARRYAEQLDEDLGRLARLGRPFLAVLVELRLTPKARAGVLSGSWPEDDEADAPLPAEDQGGGAPGDGDRERDEVDELRARRDRRPNRAAAVD